MIPFIAAWVAHTEQSRAMAQNFERALTRHHVKHETAASLMELDAVDFGKQLSGAKPLNLWRLGFLLRHPDTAPVYLTWLSLEARRHGAEMLTAEDRELLVSAARIGTKRMAKILPTFFHQQRSA